MNKLIKKLLINNKLNKIINHNYNKCLFSIIIDDKRRKNKTVTIDTSGIIGLRPIDDNISNNTVNTSNKEIQTELGKDLSAYIKLRGPITIHDYMTQCLNHPKYGYYQTNNNIKIGKQGDFITAPELSQLFGEMISIWLISIWENYYQTVDKIDLIELGPGNGTLMSDILRCLKKFPKLYKSIRIHMVEFSSSMRDKQKQLLDCKPINSVDLTNILYATNDNIPINWYNFLHEIPKDKNIPSFIIGQEFLDIFPVHQFVYTENGWREKLIDVDTSDESPYHFRYVISPKATPAVKAILGNNNQYNVNVGMSKNLDNQEIDSKVDSNFIDLLDRQSNQLKEGDSIEISPMALSTCEDISLRLKEVGGASLLIDYGTNYTQSDSLRGYFKHNQVNVLSQPGLVDMTVDIDFSACIKSAIKSGCNVSQPLTQRDFLLSYGVVNRLENIIEDPNTSEELAESLYESFKVLIDDKHMGERFKVLCISHPTINNIHGFNNI